MTGALSRGSLRTAEPRLDVLVQPRSFIRYASLEVASFRLRARGFAQETVMTDDLLVSPDDERIKVKHARSLRLYRRAGLPAG